MRRGRGDIRTIQHSSLSVAPVTEQSRVDGSASWSGHAEVAVASSWPLDSAS
jgi:hypothetical protein